MKSANLTSAYQIQRKILTNKNIGCYKVGASNYSSAIFFGVEEIILGGIEAGRIHFSEIEKHYASAELELVVRIRLDNGATSGYAIISQHIGIECPFSDVDNPDGYAFLGVADNCSAGDLVILEDYIGDYSEHITVCVNGSHVVSGSFDNLRFSIDTIISKTLTIIKDNDLPFEKEIYIATGGLTGNFALNCGDQVEVYFE
jgi:hypothetical protein